MQPVLGLQAGTVSCKVQHNLVLHVQARSSRHAPGPCGAAPAGPQAAAAPPARAGNAQHGTLLVSLPWVQTHMSWRAAALPNGEAAVLVAEASLEEQPGDQQQCADALNTYSLLHQLHSMCDDCLNLASPAQLHAWAASVQPLLACMALAEVTYMAACLRHHHYLWQQLQQQQQQQPRPLAGFVVSPSFLQDACAAACAAATTVREELQQQQPEQAPDLLGASATDHQALSTCLHQLLDLLQWAAAEVVQQRHLLQQQLLRMQQAQQQQQGGGIPNAASPAQLQAYRQQLQQQVEAQQQVQQLLLHPLLLQALPQANCWQLQQLLVCYGQLGQTPRFSWMGHWLAAARHAMSDLALMYQPQEWHLQHQHGPHWQQHIQEHRAAAAAAYVQLVGLLSGLAAAHVKPQDGWIASWEQAARTVLSARPCFQALEQHDNSQGNHGSFFSMLQQLLQSVSGMGLGLSADFWTAHEDLVQAQVLTFSPSELLRLLQLHQQSHMRPSKACIKYMTAVLEQHLSHECQALLHQGSGADSGTESGVGSKAVLQLVMCVCGLSVWGVRLHLRSVAELLLLLEGHKQQLPLSVVLQVMSILGTRMARVYSMGSTSASLDSNTSSGSSSGSSGGSGSFSSGSSMCTLSTEEDVAASEGTVVSSSLAAAAVQHLLFYAAEQLGPRFVRAEPPAASHGSSTITDVGPLLKLLHITATLARNCARASSSAAGAAMSFRDSVTSLAAATAAAGADTGSVASSTLGVPFLDRLVHKLHPLCAAIAPVCTPQQLLSLMTAWNQLGFSAAWRFGGFRQGYRRLGQQGVVQDLSNAELACVVEAVAKLPQTQSVVQALAAEVMRRQARQPASERAQGQDMHAHQQAAQGTGGDLQGVDAIASGAAGCDPAAAAAAAAEQGLQPLSAPQLLSVICAVPSLSPCWPADATLQLLQHVQGALAETLNPSQQWRLWNALQQLQQQWKPSVVAAAAAAAAADSSSPGNAAPGSAGKCSPSNGMHPSVAFAAAAAAAGLKAPSMSAPVQSVSDSEWADWGLAVRPRLPSASQDSGVELQEAQTLQQPQQQQQQLMRLLDELQDQVAAALARVQDPDALPLEAAPPKLPRPLDAQQQDEAAEGATVAQYAEDGRRTEQQVLAAFAKAQKSLLNPQCNGAAMVKVLEGLLLLLAVPRYARAARKNETVRRAVLRALEASAWPDLLAQSLDIQQLLLLTAAAWLLGSGTKGPYMQLLGQETSRVLVDVPLKFLASGLGRMSSLRLPDFFSTNVVLLKFWVGRLAQAARQRPEEALAVVVPLTQLGFRPGAGAAGLVLQPLLAAAAAGVTPGIGESTGAGTNSSAGSNDSDSSSMRSAASLSPSGVLSLTKVLAATSLRPDTERTKQLLQAHISIMRHLNVPQLLQVCRDVLILDLLTTATPSTAAAEGAQDAASASDANQHGRSWLLPGAGAWVVAWLKQLLERDATTQMDVAQVVELQLLLCDLDLVPWHLSSTAYSASINTRMQQLQAKLDAIPGWQVPLATAVQASYHSTQELRRLVAARARKAAHGQGGSNSSSNGMAGSGGGSSVTSLGSVRSAVAAAMRLGDSADASSSASSSSSSSNGSDAYTGEAYSGTRRFVSRKAAAAAAAAAGSTQGGAAGGFTYPANPVSHQLQQLTHQKRVLLWGAIKHQVVKPLNAAWVESCCFNVLVGGHPVTPVVVMGLLTAVLSVRSRGDSSVGAAASPSADAAMRERALANLTKQLVYKVLGWLKVLRGAMFVQALASLAAAGVSASGSRDASQLAAAQTGAAASAVAPEQQRAAVEPLYTLSSKQQLLILSEVARVVPFLQPAQLPLLVSSMLRLQLQPDAAWLADVLQALAVKAAAAAGAGQPAQQLLLLAAAKQLLICGGALPISQPPAAAPSAAVAVGEYGSAQRGAPVALGGRSPVAFALRALAAGAAQVLGSIFRRSWQQGNTAASVFVAASSSGSGGAANGAISDQHEALAAAAAVAAAMSDVPGQGDSSVALLLSSLATQLQLGQSAAGDAAAAAAAAGHTEAQQALSTDRAAALLRALQARKAGQATCTGMTEPQDAHKQQQRLLAAAVLLQAGSGPAAQLPAAVSADASAQSLRVMRRAPRYKERWDGSWHGLYAQDRERQAAEQHQQQQRVLLGQLLQLQLQKASEHLVQVVWASKMPDAQEQPSTASASASAADVYATQLLLDPTGDLLSGEQQQGAEQRNSGRQQQLQRPHRLVTQGLQVQFDGLLRKAFMAAAAAAAGGRQTPTQSGDEVMQAGASGQREPWWLPKAPRDVSGLLQAAPEGNVGASLLGDGSACSTDGLRLQAAVGAAAAGNSVGSSSASEGGSEAGVDSRAGSGGPVLVLPVMSRALDAQFARLMREVLHSSLAASGGSRGSS